MAVALQWTKWDRHVFVNGFVCRVCMSVYLVVVLMDDCDFSTMYQNYGIWFYNAVLVPLELMNNKYIFKYLSHIWPNFTTCQDVRKKSQGRKTKGWRKQRKKQRHGKYAGQRRTVRTGVVTVRLPYSTNIRILVVLPVLWRHVCVCVWQHEKMRNFLSCLSSRISCQQSGGFYFLMLKGILEIHWTSGIRELRIVLFGDRGRGRGGTSRGGVVFEEFEEYFPLTFSQVVNWFDADSKNKVRGGGGGGLNHYTRK